MKWTKYKNEFEWDGSLLDLYTLDIHISHWQRLIELLQGTYSTIFTADGNVTSMPKDVADIFHLREEKNVLMAIELDGIQINCHFFTEDEIEFDIDPREISTEEKATRLFEFMQIIGKTLQKEVILTPENLQGEVIFKYVPETDDIVYFPPRNGMDWSA